MNSCENRINGWQDTKTSINQRTAFLFNNELLSDIRFIVGEGTDGKQTIFAHKFILSIASSVFNAMFNGPLATASDEIDIADIEPQAFLVLLKFFYTDLIVIENTEIAISTLYAAKKYHIPIIVNESINFLMAEMTGCDAITILMRTQSLGERALALKCWETIDQYAKIALESDGFTNVDLDMLCSIISRDSLCIKEIDLFEAVMKWTLAECRRRELPETSENQRLVLGAGLQLIRFPLMTALEFSATVSRTELLTESEIISLYQCIIEGRKGSIEYSVVPRNPLFSFFPGTLDRMREERHFIAVQSHLLSWSDGSDFPFSGRRNF